MNTLAEVCIYLAGPIHGRTDSECRGWRSVAKAALEAAGNMVLDPMDRDYRGVEEDFAEVIVAGDKQAIDLCGLVLVNANEPSWGTAMEVAYAWDNGKQVVAFCDAPSVSPWLRCHTHAIYRTSDQAIGGILKHRTEGLR